MNFASCSYFCCLNCFFTCEEVTARSDAAVGLSLGSWALLRILAADSRMLLFEDADDAPQKVMDTRKR